MPTAAYARWTACWLQRRWFSPTRYVCKRGYSFSAHDSRALFSCFMLEYPGYDDATHGLGATSLCFFYFAGQPMSRYFAVFFFSSRAWP